MVIFMKKMVSILLSMGITSTMCSGILPIVSTAHAAGFDSQLQQMIEENMLDYVGELEFTIGNSRYTVDGASKRLEDDIAPTIIDDSTMLPVRAIAEALGGSADFDSSSGDITIKKDDTTLVMRNGQQSVDVDMGGSQDSIETDVAPTIVDGTTLVPVRLVSETLGAAVQWNGNERSIRITPDYQTKRIIVKSKQNKNLDFSRYNPKKVIDDGKGLYIVQFNTSIGDASIKKYCDQIENNMSNAEYADPDIIMESCGAGSSFSGIDTLDYVQLKQYAAALKDKSLHKVNVGIIEFGKYANSNGILDNANMRKQEVGLSDSYQMKHATLDAAIINSGMKEMGKDNYSLYCYSTIGGDAATFSSALISTIEAMDPACDVISISLDAPSNKRNVEVLESYINSKDTLFVCAAGNTANGDPVYSPSEEYGHYPAAFAMTCNNVLSVAATGSNDEPYSDSNYGASNGAAQNAVSIAAPGVDVLVESLEAMSGTSQAAPHVAAAAALLKAQYGYPAAQLKSELMSGKYTVPIKNDGGHYYGMGTLRMPVSGNSTSVTPSPATPSPITPSPETQKPVTPNPETPRPVTPSPDTQNQQQKNQEESIIAYEFSSSDQINITVGDAENVKVYAKYDSGRQEDVTSRVNLVSTDESVATVSASGRIKAVGAGKTRIIMSMALSASVSIPAPVTVIVEEDEVSLSEYEWSDTSFELEVAESDYIKLYAVYSDGTRKDVTSNSALTSSDESIARVTDSGMIIAVAPGTARINMGMASSASVSIPKGAKVVVKESERSSIMYGDVTSDGKVNNKDVTTLQKVLNGSESFNDKQEKAADVNGDGNIDDYDLNLLKKYVMGIISSFPAE